MSKRDAIEQLKLALRMANLPSPKDRGASHERAESGEVIAASMAFRVGAMEAHIELALAHLGARE